MGPSLRAAGDAPGFQRRPLCDAGEQDPASFSLTNVKAKIEAAIKAHHGD